MRKFYQRWSFFLLCCKLFSSSVTINLLRAGNLIGKRHYFLGGCYYMLLRQILFEEVYLLYSDWPSWKIKLPRAHPLWQYDKLLPLFRYLFTPTPLLSPNLITRSFQVKTLERAFTRKLVLIYLIFPWKFAFVEIIKFYEFWDVFKLFQVSQKL